jgi:hypothetical protein
MRKPTITVLIFAIGILRFHYAISEDQSRIFFTMVDQQTFEHELNLNNLSLKAPFEFHRIPIFKSTEFFQGIMFTSSGHEHEFNTLVNRIDKKAITIIPTVNNGITLFEDNLKSPCLVGLFNRVISMESIKSMNCSKAIELANAFVKLSDSKLTFTINNDSDCQKVGDELQIKGAIGYEASETELLLSAAFNSNGWLLKKSISTTAKRN